MKKILATTVLTLLLVIPSLAGGDSLEDAELKEGDVCIWRPEEFKHIGFDCPSIVYESLCPNIEKLWSHVDYVVDGETGEIMTADPLHGAGGTSTIESRVESETWTDLVVIRNPNLDVEAATKLAKSLEGDYDWLGYYLHLIDLTPLFPASLPPYCSKFVLARGISRALQNYHCASFTFTVVGIEKPHITTPFDVINGINDGTITDWEIVGTY